MIRAPFFVTAATATADLLAAELAALGIEGAREVQGGVACEGDLAAAYRACLESRIGLRVLWQLAAKRDGWVARCTSVELDRVNAKR